MKKKGFIDLYLSEWHANNYPAWIDEQSKKLGLDYKVAYAWAEQDISPRDGVTTDQWCEKNGVIRCNTLEEVCEKSDVIIILAPSNPETHLGYAEKVLSYGKRTYIDKTFAQNEKDAKAIFELGEKYGTPFFSTSALRYADGLSDLAGSDSIIVTGGGSNLPEYFVHIAEIAVKIMGLNSFSVTAYPNGTQTVFRVTYKDGRDATLIYGKSMPYTVYYAKGEKEQLLTLGGNFFNGLIADILTFFETGKTSFSQKETLEVIRLRDAALHALIDPEIELIF